MTDADIVRLALNMGDQYALADFGEKSSYTPPAFEALARLEARIEELEKALAACRPVGSEFCPWCWGLPPHRPDCPIAETENAARRASG